MNRHRSTSTPAGRTSIALRFLRGRVLASAVAAGATVHLGSLGVASAGALQHDPAGTGCDSASLPANDDAATGPVNIGFAVNLNGNMFASLHVDNNGYVLFNATPPATFDYPSLKLDTTSLLLIAPFLADVDTRATGSDLVTYGQTTFGSRDAFCVTWGGRTGVGHFDAKVNTRNSFQLLLVDRSDVGVGDFDIVLNYDKIEWDQTDNVGVFPVFAGFTTGTVGSPQLLAGPAAPGALLDSNTTTGLVHATNGGILGRSTFAVRNGIPPSSTAISGTVRDPNGLPLAGAPVTACRTDGLGTCVQTFTNGLGGYVLKGFQAVDLGNAFTITASAPAADVWLAVTGAPILVDASAPITGQDLTLDAPEGIPVGTTITPSNMGGGNVPTVFWGNPLTINTHGCQSGSASYSVTQETASGEITIRSGVLTESALESSNGAGSYSATVPPFQPSHGYAKVTVTLSCPDGSNGSSSFDIYIDPSGKVHNTHGAPIEGAKVTLFRSDNAFGPFEEVADGSAIMSPSNRRNSMLTDATGFFGWDVIAGYYIVRAEKAGCTRPGSATDTIVKTAVLAVPEPITDLDLILDCDAVPPPSLVVPSSVTAEATSAAGAAVSFAVAAIDGADGEIPVHCSPASGSVLSLGTTTVVCSAQNSAGNSASASFTVTVVDTKGPALNLPADMTVFATSSAGSVVSYSASAFDKVSGAITPACSPASGSLFSLGSTQVTCSAADTRGNASSGGFHVNVVYDGFAFASPINADGSSSFEQWYTLPVNFTLGGVSTGITNASPLLYFARVEGGLVGAEQPGLPAGHSNCANLFVYDAAAGRYSYRLSTDTMDPGLYQLRVDLGDGVLHAVLVTVD